MFGIETSSKAHGSRINPCPQTARGKTLQFHRQDLQASPLGFPVSRARPRCRKANPTNKRNHQDSPDSANSSPFRPESAWLEMNAKPGMQWTSLDSKQNGLKNADLHSIQKTLLSSRSISRKSRVRTLPTSIPHQVSNKGSQDKSTSISSASKRRCRVFKLRFGKRSYANVS